MILTERDKNLLNELANYGVLSTRQISKSIFGNIRKTTVLRRLRTLERAKYMLRHEGLGNGELTWTVSTEGLRKIGSALPPKYLNRNSLEHDVQLADLRLTLTSVGLGQNWIPEHVLKAKHASKNGGSDEPRMVPDGLFTTIYKNKAVSVAVELEIQPKSKARYEKILRRYAWMKTVFAVWYFVRNKSLGETIQDHYQNIGIVNSSKPQLIWSHVDEVIHNPFESKLTYQQNQLFVRDIFPLKPAHTIAHTVSTHSATNSTFAAKVSARNPEETPPARTL